MNHAVTVRYTTIALVLGGFGAIFLAWNGAAGEDHVPAQLPYLISGGLAGLVLAAAGLTLLRNFEARRDSLRVEGRLDALRDAIDRLAAEQHASASPSTPSWPPAGVPAPPSHPTRTQPGSAAGAAAAPLSPEDHATVVAGPSTYHRHDCHLVAKRQVPTTTRAAARQRDLSACRVCNPDRPRPTDQEPAASNGTGDDTGSGWEPVR